MSHISRIKTQFAEKKYLLAAITDLGFTYEEQVSTLSGFNQQNIPVEIKIPLRVSYDIGFQKSGDFYVIVADWFGVRGINKNQFVNQLTQRYAYHAAKDKLESQGFTLVEETAEKGKIRLVLRRMA